MSMMEKKPSTAAKLWKKFTEGAGIMMSCVIVGTGLKLGANIADILTEKFEDRFGQDNRDNDPITAIASAAGLTEEEDINDDDDLDDEDEDPDDEEELLEAEGISDSKEVEEEIAVTFPARDSKGRFVKRTMTVAEPEPAPAEEVIPETSEAEEPTKEKKQVEATEESAEDAEDQVQEQEEETQQ